MRSDAALHAEISATWQESRGFVYVILYGIPVSDEPRTSVAAERHGHPRPCKRKGPSYAGKDERQRTFRRPHWSAAVSIHGYRRLTPATT